MRTLHLLGSKKIATKLIVILLSDNVRIDVFEIIRSGHEPLRPELCAVKIFVGTPSWNTLEDLQTILVAEIWPSVTPLNSVPI